jgi:hypothetical protein
MNSIRSIARRRGLRMAAQVASIAGVVAASAALSHAAPARPAAADIAPSGAESVAVSDEGKGIADQLGDAVRVRSSSGCGCSPCWGPPAPPPMRAELFEEGLS